MQPNDTGKIRPCQECKRLTRPSGWPPHKHPGTIAYAGLGLCTNCRSRQLRETQTTEPQDKRPTTEQNKESLLAYWKSRRPYRKALGQTIFPDPFSTRGGMKLAMFDTNRTWSTRKPAPCGTPAAYQRHLRDGDPIDDDCRAAHAERASRYRARKKTTA